MKSKFYIAILILTFGSMAENAAAQEMNYRAYTLFIYNFMKYIEWPAAGGGDFVVGVYGDSPIVAELEGLAKTKKAQGRTIVIKKITSDKDAVNCNLVYIIASKSGTLKTLLPLTDGKPILLVGEREGLSKKGTHISFVELDDDQLKFDINKASLEKNLLKIPQQLVSLGFVVG